MFLPEILYSWPQNNNSFEGAPRFAEKHDGSQSMYPARIGKTCECGRCIFCSSIPSTDCVCQSEDALINNNISEGDSGLSVYAHPLKEVNNISNSFSMHHEDNSGELNPAAYFKKQDESSGLNLNESGNTFLNNQDFVGGKATSFTARNNKGKKKARNAEISANIPVGRRPHIGFRVNRTARDLKGSRISRPSGNKDRHSKVLTLKGPRDRRIRLSVGTAIKLYSVQDMLGVEQPGQAVEWLIGKSQNVIRDLPQLSSISSSHISDYVQSNTAAVSVTCHQAGDLSTSMQVNTSTASGDFLVNLHEQILSAKTVIGHKTFTAMTTKSGNKHSIVHGEKREQRSIAMRSVASSHKARETASALPQKERRAIARERARDRTKDKAKRCNQHSGIYGILQPSSVPHQATVFSSQDNTISASSLNMMNETTDGIGNVNAFQRSLMFPKDSILLNESSLCVSFPPAETQSSSLAGVHYSTAQQEGISIQSTGAFSSLNPEVFPLTPDPFPQAVTTINNSGSYSALCKCPLDHAHLKSSNSCLSCREDSIKMPATDDGGLETSYEWLSSWNKEIFEEFLLNEEIEIPGIKSSNQFVPSRINQINPSPYFGMFGRPQ